jgi:hypothetical protein
MEFEIHDLFKWVLMHNIVWTYLKWEVMIVNLCGNASIESSYYSNNFRLKLRKESALCNGGASTRLCSLLWVLLHDRFWELQDFKSK